MIACQIAVRFGDVAGPHSVDVAGRFDALGLKQIFDHVIARFVGIGVDAVRGEIPSFMGEAHADVATYLANPYRPLVEAQRRQPEPQVQTLVDRAARGVAGPRSRLRPNKYSGLTGE